MMLLDWINNQYLDKEELIRLRKKYSSAKPFPHIVLDEFFVQEKLLAVEEALREEEFYEKNSDLFSLAQTKQLSNSENKVIKEFVTLVGSEEFSTWMYELTNIWTTTKNPDVFGALYQDTDYLLPHDDQLENRKLAYIIYLSTLKEEGGNLLLYDDVDGHPGSVKKTYPPKKNQLALFTVSKSSWHEVEEIRGRNARVSIGGWLHGRD